MASNRWLIDPARSRIQFSVRYLASRMPGTFTEWSGELWFDPERPESSSVEIDIDARSVETDDPQRNLHLRSADFFDAEKYPRVQFRSTHVDRVGPRTLSVAGRLTIRAISRGVVLHVEYMGSQVDPNGSRRAG